MSESYDHARRYGSRWRLIEMAIGTIFIVLGGVLFAYTQGETFLPLALVAIGVIELLSGTIKKFIWLRRHSKSKLFNAEVDLTLDDEGITSTGPFSTSRMQWDGIEKVVRTPRGVLVWPQKGMYMYLPESAVGKDALSFISSKVA